MSPPLGSVPPYGDALSVTIPYVLSLAQAPPGLFICPVVLAGVLKVRHHFLSATLVPALDHCLAGSLGVWCGF